MVAILFRGMKPYNFCAILAERNIKIHARLFQICTSMWEMSLKAISIFSSGGLFVQWSGTICAILVVGMMGNFPVKLFYI